MISNVVNLNVDLDSLHFTVGGIYLPVEQLEFTPTKNLVWQVQFYAKPKRFNTHNSYDEYRALQRSSIAFHDHDRFAYKLVQEFMLTTALYKVGRLSIREIDIPLGNYHKDLIVRGHGLHSLVEYNHSTDFEMEVAITDTMKSIINDVVDYIR